MSDYRPVACDLYARYELAILRRWTVMLAWGDGEGITRLERVRPMDLETCHGEEFLHIRTAAGQPRRVRLDRIVGFRGVGGGAEGPFRDPELCT